MCAWEFLHSLGVSVVQKLTQWGADVNTAVFERGQWLCPLYAACRHLDFETARFLLSAGADASHGILGVMDSYDRFYDNIYCGVGLLEVLLDQPQSCDCTYVPQTHACLGSGTFGRLHRSIQVIKVQMLAKWTCIRMECTHATATTHYSLCGELITISQVQTSHYPLVELFVAGSCSLRKCL